MNIDRREFLKSIAGLALVPYLKNLNLDSEKVVNQTWEKLVEDPFVFEVNSQCQKRPFSALSKSASRTIIFIDVQSFKTYPVIKVSKAVLDLAFET